MLGWREEYGSCLFGYWGLIYLVTLALAAVLGVQSGGINILRTRSVVLWIIIEVDDLKLQALFVLASGTQRAVWSLQLLNVHSVLFQDQIACIIMGSWVSESSDIEIAVWVPLEMVGSKSWCRQMRLVSSNVSIIIEIWETNKDAGPE